MTKFMSIMKDGQKIKAYGTFIIALKNRTGADSPATLKPITMNIYGSISSASAYSAITVLNFSDGHTAKQVATLLFVWPSCPPC